MYKYKSTNMKTMKNTYKPKKIKGFPDYTGDGKITYKDILIGRGVIKKRGGMKKRGRG